MASPPQPVPISSRWSSGPSSSSVQTRSSRACCASARLILRPLEERARVHHRLVEEEGEHVVAHVVVGGDVAPRRPLAVARHPAHGPVRQPQQRPEAPPPAVERRHVAGADPGQRDRVVDVPEPVAVGLAHPDAGAQHLPPEPSVMNLDRGMHVRVRIPEHMPGPVLLGHLQVAAPGPLQEAESDGSREPTHRGCRVVQPGHAAEITRLTGPAPYPWQAMTKVKICGITKPADAEAAVALGAWAIGLNPLDGARATSTPPSRRRSAQPFKRQAARSSASSSTRLSRRSRGGRERRADHGPAPRRRGPLLLRRGRAPHRRQGDQGASTCAAPPTSGRPRPTAPTTTCFDGFQQDNPGGTGKSFDWELARRAPLQGPDDPRRRAHARERRRGDRGHASLRDRRRQRRRVRARASRTPRSCAAFSRRVPGRRPRRRPERGHRGERSRSVRPLRRPLRPRDADRGARRADRRLGGGARRRRRSRASSARLLRDFVGRPTPLYLAERLSERVGRRVYLKREDLAHTGAHKINNAVGQALLAKRMGKPRVIAETGAGQHGVADRHRLRAARPRVRRLHGRPRTSAARRPTSSA